MFKQQIGIFNQTMIQYAYIQRMSEWVSEWVSEWLLFRANSAIYQLCHGVNFQRDDDEVSFVLDQHAELDFYITSSLKQQSVGRHIAPLGNTILILSRSVFALST